MIIGSDNRYLVPASMLAGAAILLLADTASRLITSVNVPVGVIMSFIGGPVFLAIILLTRKEVW
jgi:iron complex transport system permease protein